MDIVGFSTLVSQLFNEMHLIKLFHIFYTITVRVNILEGSKRSLHFLLLCLILVTVTVIANITCGDPQGSVLGLSVIFKM